MIRLRVRGSDGTVTFSIDSTSTVGELKKIISNKLKVAPTSQQLLTGFPPKQVIASDDELAKEYFKSGDSITLRETSAKSKPTTKAPTTKPAPKPQRPITKPSRDSSSSIRSGPSTDSIANEGQFVIRVVPDDNSCLFRAVNGILGQPKSSAYALRQIVANAIGSNPHMYSSAFLGRPNMEYRAWIQGDNAWGGAIELGILAKHFNVEIGAFDLKTMRMDKYGEGNNYATIGYLIYDGIHYNYLALSLSSDSSYDICQFNTNDLVAQRKARDICQIAHTAKQYTDTQNFNIKCDDCGTKLRGEAEVVKHANATGHGNFSEAR